MTVTETEAERMLEKVRNEKSGLSQKQEMKELIARTVGEAHQAL